MTREQAVRMGLPRYFTGKPCPRGHLSTRLVSCRACEECSRIGRRVIRGQVEAPSYIMTDMCESCGGPPGYKGLHEDHDYKTGLFRGYICSRCNTAIGLLGDSYETVLAAAEYLRNAELPRLQPAPFWDGVALGIVDTSGKFLSPRAAERARNFRPALQPTE